MAASADAPDDARRKTLGGMARHEPWRIGFQQQHRRGERYGGWYHLSRRRSEHHLSSERAFVRVTLLRCWSGVSIQAFGCSSGSIGLVAYSGMTGYRAAGDPVDMTSCELRGIRNLNKT
jgi:hypothetical protein